MLIHCALQLNFSGVCETCTIKYTATFWNVQYNVSEGYFFGIWISKYLVSKLSHFLVYTSNIFKIYISNIFVLVYQFFWIAYITLYSSTKRHELSLKLHAGNERKDFIRCQVACWSKICTTSNEKVQCNM